MGSPKGRPAKQPYMVFGGAPHDAVQTRDDAIERCKKAHNVLHLGYVPLELQLAGSEAWHDGKRVRAACPAPRRFRQPVKVWLMDTACGHDLINESVR